MNRFEARHPGEDLLLLYFDGELTARRKGAVEEHVTACWQCRSGVEEIRRTAEECVRYRATLRAVQAPPAPWRDLSRDFARIDAEMAGSRPHWRWAVAAAALVVLGAGLFEYFRETPSVEAAALLRKAVAASASAPEPRHHLRVRTKSRVARFEDAPEIRAMFVQARYPIEDPLSALSYQQWRDAQNSKSDQVETITAAEPPFDRCYRIRTVAAEGELASASLMLRTADLHPVAGRFEFRNQDWVELTESADTAVEEPGEGAPVRRTIPRSAGNSPGSASISDELAVVAALHGIGADLGDPLEITRSGNRVLVSGIGISSERQQQIHRALEPLAHVSVQFSDPASSPLPQEQQPAPGEASSPVTKPSGLGERLAQAWGGRAEFERVSAQLLNWNDTAMSRVYALRTLAQRFPAETERTMNPADRETLHDLARAHLAALAAQTASIARALAPVLGPASAAAETASPQAWQASVEQLFQAARNSDLLLTTLLGAVRDQPAAPDLATNLRSALDRLQTSTAACQKALR